MEIGGGEKVRDLIAIWVCFIGYLSRVFVYLSYWTSYLMIIIRDIMVAYYDRLERLLEGGKDEQK